MENYRVFKQSQIKQLWSKRNGWFRPTYEITDGTSSYGMLSHHGFFSSVVQIDTAGATWIIRNERFSNIQITTPEGLLIGTVNHKWFSSKMNFTAADGFTATYYRPSIWSAEYVWESKDGQVLLSYQVPGFRGNEVFTFGDLAYEQPHLLLLAFLALELNLRRRRQGAAAT